MSRILGQEDVLITIFLPLLAFLYLIHLLRGLFPLEKEVQPPQQTNQEYTKQGINSTHKCLFHEIFMRMHFGTYQLPIQMIPSIVAGIVQYFTNWNYNTMAEARPQTLTSKMGRVSQYNIVSRMSNFKRW